MISLGDTRGVGPPVPNRDASQCGRNTWQKSSTSQKTSTIQHHRLHHSAIAAYLKNPLSHNPLIARKPPIWVTQYPHRRRDPRGVADPHRRGVQEGGQPIEEHHARHHYAFGRRSALCSGGVGGGSDQTSRFRPLRRETNRTQPRGGGRSGERGHLTARPV